MEALMGSRIGSITAGECRPDSTFCRQSPSERAFGGVKSNSLANTVYPSTPNSAAW